MIGPELDAIRATRAKPRFLAGLDDERRQVYDAAIQQFEELLRGAAGIGPASRPILLFYALSQAGRAIVAEFERDEFKVHGHGLQFPPVQDPVTLSGVKQDRKKPGLFGAVCRCVTCPPLPGTIPLGAAWCANPDLLDIGFADARQWNRPLSAKMPPGPLAFALAGLPPPSTPPSTDLTVEVELPFGRRVDEAAEILAAFPSTTGATIEEIKQPSALPWWLGQAVLLRWPTEADDSGLPRPYFGDVLESAVDRGASGLSSGYLVPALAPGAAPPALVSWWLVLFALSNLARYEPAVWRRAIDPNSSELAVPLERVMTRALDRLPARVLKALTAVPGPRFSPQWASSL